MGTMSHHKENSREPVTPHQRSWFSSRPSKGQPRHERSGSASRTCRCRGCSLCTVASCTCPLCSGAPACHARNCNVCSCKRHARNQGRGGSLRDLARSEALLVCARTCMPCHVHSGLVDGNCTSWSFAALVHSCLESEAVGRMQGLLQCWPKPGATAGCKASDMRCSACCDCTQTRRQIP